MTTNSNDGSSYGSSGPSRPPASPPSRVDGEELAPSASRPSPLCLDGEATDAAAKMEKEDAASIIGVAGASGTSSLESTVPEGNTTEKPPEEDVDLSNLMTLLFQHLRTDEGRAEFQRLVDAEEAKEGAEECQEVKDREEIDRPRTEGGDAEDGHAASSVTTVEST